ncbi:MAG: AmmeMemoRadiSam system protein A [Alphaproteobacteria bacterium]
MASDTETEADTGTRAPGQVAPADGSAGRRVRPTLEQISRIDRMVLERHGKDLVKLIVRAIDYGLVKDAPPKVAVNTFAKELQVKRATFVTLEKGGELRGCIGTIVANRPLVEDVVENAFRAAFKDPRFPPVTEDEKPDLSFSLSVLSPMSEMRFDGEADFLDQLRPLIDGVLIEDGGKRAVFLPQVWEQLPEKQDFLNHLRKKAGLPPDHWSDTMQAWRFTVQKIPPLGFANHAAG